MDDQTQQPGTIVDADHHGGARQGAGQPADPRATLNRVRAVLNFLTPSSFDEPTLATEVGVAVFNTLAKLNDPLMVSLGFVVWDQWAMQLQCYHDIGTHDAWDILEHPGMALDHPAGQMAADPKRRLDFGALYNWVKEDAARTGRKPLIPGRQFGATSVEIMEALRVHKFDFRLNLAGGVLEVRTPEMVWVEMADPLYRRLRTMMRDNGWGRDLPAVEDAYWTHAAAHAYHPIRQYLDGLEWDGADHITALASYFTLETAAEAGLFPAALKHWFVGAVRRAQRVGLDSKGIQVFMMVLLGPQGLGKSYFVEWVASPLEQFLKVGGVHVGDKDTFVSLAKKWVWEVDEFEQVSRRAEIEAFKSFVSRTSVDERRSYDRYHTNGPALANFIGTSNKLHVLVDETGNRRFPTFGVAKLDWKYATMVDINQVWAQAAALAAEGYPHQLTADEGTQRDTVNERFQVEDPVQENITKYLAYGPDHVGWMYATDVAGLLKLAGLKFQSERALAMAVADAMRVLGVSREKKRLGMDERKFLWAYNVSLNDNGEVLWSSKWTVGKLEVTSGEPPAVPSATPQESTGGIR